MMLGIEVYDLVMAMAGIAARGAFVLAIVGLAAWLARGRSAALRHRLWTAALAAQLLLPFAALTLPRWPVAILPTPPLTAPSTPAAGAAAPQSGPTGAVTVTAVLDVGSAGATSTPGRSLPQLLLALWALGALGLVFRRVKAEARLAGWIGQARPLNDHRLAALRAAAAGLGIRGAVRVIESEHAGVPLVCGVRSPVVVLPRSSASWDRATLRGVLLHELAHVRRGDVGWNLVAQLVRALFWFDPLIWVATHRMRVEGEQAADDVVLGAGERASGYAGALLGIARTVTPRGPAAGLALIARSGLSARIEAILARHDRRPPARREMMIGGLVLAATVALLAVVDPGPGAAPASRSSTTRAARYTNSPGSPVRILSAEVQVLPALGHAPGEVRVTRPRLRIENLDDRRITALQLRLGTPRVSTDQLWEEVDLDPGKVLDLRLPERTWSNQAPAELATRVVVGIAAVRFENGDLWRGRGRPVHILPWAEPGDGAETAPRPEAGPESSTPSEPPQARSAPEAAPTPEATPAPAPAPEGVPAWSKPTKTPKPSDTPRAPRPGAELDGSEPLPEPISYLSARFSNPAGAPLVIEEARTPVFAGGSRRGVTALPIVTFRNVTDLRVTRVRLRFKAGADAHAVTVIRTPIEPHGTLVFRRDGLDITGDPRKAAVQVIGVLLEDGTIWGTLDSTIDTREPWIYPLEEPGRR